MVRTTGKTADFAAVRNKGGDVWLVNFGRKTVSEPEYKENEDGTLTPTGETVETELSTWTEELFTARPTLGTLLQVMAEDGTPQDYADVATGMGYSDDETLQPLRTLLQEKIGQYDTSDSVNSFTLGGKAMWLPKETRVGLVNSITIEKQAGKEETTLWFGGEKYTLAVDTALQMLAALELYALECYNTTQKHLAEVDSLETVSDVCAYDYTAGYPDKLALEL